MPTWPASAPKTIMGIRSLVLFVLLSTIATCALAAADTSTCDICKCGKGECDRIRLGDPTRNSSAGQIQVCWGDYWQTICGPTHDESHRFTKNDANVACFQLGFTRAGPTAAVDRGSACKPGQESYLVVGTPCKGWEEQLSDCHLQPAEPSGICTPQTAIDVTCETTVQVKLVHGGASSYLGKVMHYFNSSWRTVCDKNWVTKMSNSDVLCRQLGLGHALDHWLHVSSGEDTHFLHMNIDCSGTEDKLRLCPHNFTISNTCDRMSVPWVVCSEVSDFEVSASSTSITLQWSVPGVLKYYPVVQGYNISYREKTSKDSSKTVPLGLYQREVTFGGLKAGTQYFMTVLVVLEDDHPGPESMLVVSTTDIPNADPRVIGLAIGLGLSLCGYLLACVILVIIAARRRYKCKKIELFHPQAEGRRDGNPVAINDNERDHLLHNQPVERMNKSI